MRMNKKLKNVLAFGLATSFVLTSTMGVSATGDAVSYDDVTTYAATDMPTAVTKILHVNFWDLDTNSQVGDVKEFPHEFEATEDTYTFSSTLVSAPEGYTIVKLPSLTLDKNTEETWVTVDVRKAEAPAPVPTPEVTKTLYVNFWDLDNNSQVGEVKEFPHVFKEGEGDTYTFSSTSVSAPEGYTIVKLPSLTLDKNTEETWVTVDVRKAEAPAPAPTPEVTKTLYVNFWDLDNNSQVGEVKEFPHVFKEGEGDTYTFSSTSVSAPEGYTIVKLPSLTLDKNTEETWVTVDVKKAETPAPAPTAVTKVLKVNFWDVDTNSQVGEVTEFTHEFESTSADDATFTFSGTSVEAPEGYTIVKQPALVLHKNYEEDWVTVDVKKVTEASTAVKKVLKVNFWDVDTNSQVGDVVSLEHEFEATSEDNATFTFAATSVETPEGYMIINQPALILHKDYEEDWVTIDVQKTKSSEAVEKVLKVNFWDVDANKQVGDVLELKHEFEATSADDATYTFAGTAVEAPAGYTVVKQPELILHKDYEEDWVTIDVQKTEAPEAVEKVLKVNFWDVDANAQVGNVIELTHVFESTSADDATFTFAGTSVEAPKGYQVVKQPALTLHKAYEEDWVTIDVQKVEDVQKTVKVVFTVDPAKGEFPGYDGSTSIHYTIDEDSAEQYLVPEVKAADGYKFVGWQVEGKESGRWDADAKTFGVTGLAFYPEGSNEGYVSIDAIFEATETELEVQKTAKVVFSVDPAKGEFPGYDGSTTIHYTIDEYSAEQYLVPEVKAADGYKFVGWQVEGKESGRWDADAKTFGVTGLAFYPEGSSEGYLSIDAIFEAVETEPTTETETKASETPATETETKASETPATETETKASETPATETETKASETPATETETKASETPATETETKASETPATETEPATEAPTSEPETKVTEAPSESETKVTESETKASEAPATTKSDDNNSNKSADTGVKTGDTTNVMPLVITLLAAVALMVVFALRKRKVVK